MFQRIVMGMVLAVAAITVQAQNTPPTVGLTSPANNAAYYTTDILTLSTNAADSDGSIAKVEFYANGSVLLGTATTAPYTSPLPLTSVTPGTYSITAKATDNQGATTTSTAASITVTANTAPAVSITAPANNATYPSPVSITITANAADSDGTISKVEFYATQAAGPYQIGVANSAPYTINLNSVSTGTYVVTAKAYDNRNAITTSAPITITVGTNAAPTISITAPASNTTYSAPASLTINATATDSDGSLKRVDFYATVGTTTYPIGSITTPPYNLPLNNVGVGNYTVTARAVDNYDTYTVSAPITINVVNGAQAYYIYADQIGTPRLITDQNNTKVWQWDNTDPFGNNAANDDPNGTGNKFEFNQRFAGQYYDKETNLHYNYYRTYDPNTGRYIESDPIGLGGGINTYGYVLGNPLILVDPFGLIHYNAPAPRTVPVAGDTEIALQCVERCLQEVTNNPGLDLLITGGAEKSGHSKTSHHYRGEACDIAGPRVNKATTSDVMICAAQCGFGAGHFEQFPKNPNRDHWHLQLTPGNGVPALTPVISPHISPKLVPGGVVNWIF